MFSFACYGCYHHLLKILLPKFNLTSLKILPFNSKHFFTFYEINNEQKKRKNTKVISSKNHSIEKVFRYFCQLLQKKY